MKKQVTVYTWEKHPSVTFFNMSETIRIDPRSQINNPEIIAAAAHNTAVARKTANPNIKVAYRLWFEFEFGPHPRAFSDRQPNTEAGRASPENWWNHTPAYSLQPISSMIVDWWAGFNNYMILNQTPIDYIVQDLEKGADIWNMPGQARPDYFRPITLDNDENPYPGGASAASQYLGQEIWNTQPGLIQTDFFISDYGQWAHMERIRVTRSLALAGLRGLSMSTTFVNDYINRYPDESSEFPVDYELLPFSNYNDYEYGFPITQEARGRPNRLPYATGRVSGISSPVVYLDTAAGTLVQAEPEYTLPVDHPDFANNENRVRNRRRWKTFLRRMSRFRSACAAVPGDVHPWIAPPTYGRNGANTWGNATNLEFEKLFFRVMMAHMERSGVDTYILWNPTSNNPVAILADVWCDAYFKDKFVDPIVRNLTEILLPAESITTGNLTTTFSELFEIETFYFSRDPELTLANSRGFGTLEDPYIIRAGQAGTLELAAIVNSIQVNQGTTIQTVEISDNPVLEIDQLYFSRLESSTDASGHGAGTSLQDPIFILPGLAGTQQATAIMDMIEHWQGYRPIAIGLLEIPQTFLRLADSTGKTIFSGVPVSLTKIISNTPHIETIRLYANDGNFNCASLEVITSEILSIQTWTQSDGTIIPDINLYVIPENDYVSINVNVNVSSLGSQQTGSLQFNGDDVNSLIFAVLLNVTLNFQDAGPGQPVPINPVDPVDPVDPPSSPPLSRVQTTRWTVRARGIMPDIGVGERMAREFR